MKAVLTIDQVEEIRRLVRDTDLSIDAIGIALEINSATVRNRAVRMGFDMKARNKRLNKHKAERLKLRTENPLSRIPDSMTGDGRSLHWLSKEWR